MRRFVAFSLIGSAMDEVLANPTLLKHAATDPDAELLDYLEKHAADVKAVADRFCANWLVGYERKLAEAGLDKAAWFGLEENHPRANLGLEMGAYMTPVLGTVLMTRDALKSFGSALGSGKTWKQRLGSGAMGLLQTGMAGLSLIPGMGIIGASLKGGGRLGKALGAVGAGGAAEWAGGHMLNYAAKPMRSMLNAAESGQGAGGKVMRAMGFNPNYKPIGHGGLGLGEWTYKLPSRGGNFNPLNWVSMGGKPVNEALGLTHNPHAALQGLSERADAVLGGAKGEDLASAMNNQGSYQIASMGSPRRVLGYGTTAMLGLGALSNSAGEEAGQQVAMGPAHPQWQYRQSLLDSMGAQ